MKNSAFAIALCALALAPVARAHVTVAPAEAAPGAELMVKLHVGHACDGKPTTAIQVEIPAQLTMAHPLEVDGWSLSGQSRDGRTTRITWQVKGAPPATPPDFQVHIGRPMALGAVRLPVTQTCGATVVRWDEAPSAAQPRPAHPAPAITVTTSPASAGPAAAGAHAH